MRFVLSISFFVFFSILKSEAQDTINTITNPDAVTRYLVPGTIIDGDTVINITIRPIIVRPPYPFTDDKQRERYTRLMLYVKKVYPYSLIVKEKYAEISHAIDTIESPKERDRYIKQKENEMREQFEGELTKLTIMQGRILIKLVDRQTGSTTYDVIKDFKGGFSAFVWQSVARIFGSNLKSEYDATGDDKMIEDIIIRIENGQL